MAGFQQGPPPPDRPSNAIDVHVSIYVRKQSLGKVRDMVNQLTTQTVRGPKAARRIAADTYGNKDVVRTKLHLQLVHDGVKQRSKDLLKQLKDELDSLKDVERYDIQTFDVWV